MKKIIYKNIEFYKIKNFPDYYISKCGKVLSLRTNNKKILKNRKNNGYVSIILYKKKYKYYDKLIHRLVAQQFILNPQNKPQVNHINGIKTDNNINNLEWCSSSENIKHSYRILNKISTMSGKFGKLHPNSRKIKQLDLNNNLIKVWDSMMDIQRDLNMHYQSVYSCCNGKIKKSNGFKWKYL